MIELLNGIMLVLWRQSWQLVILVILVWPFAHLSQRRHPRFVYILWLMVAIKSFIPLNFNLPSFNNVALQTGLPVINFTKVVNVEEISSIDLGLLVGIIWFITVLFLSTKLIVRETRFHKYLTQTENLKLAGISGLLEKFKIHQSVKIVTSSQINIPLTFGLMNPVIIIPDRHKNRDSEDLLPIIAHELAHIQRKDLLAVGLQATLNILFFFHPLMRLVNRQLDLNRERICDGLAIEALELNPRSYGKELLNHIEASMVSAPEIILSGGMFMTKNNILKRFEYLMDGKGGIMLKIKSGQKLVLGFLLLTMLVLSCSTTGKGNGAGSPVTEDGELRRVINPEDGSIDWVKAPPAEENVIFTEYDTPPEPLGGFAAVQKAVVYPELARKAGIEGTVIIQVVINQDGSPGEAVILKGVTDSGLNESALNAVKSVKWKPAMAEGKPVTVRISLPVVFRLKTG